MVLIMSLTSKSVRGPSIWRWWIIYLLQPKDCDITSATLSVITIVQKSPTIYGSEYSYSALRETGNVMYYYCFLVLVVAMAALAVGGKLTAMCR